MPENMIVKRCGICSTKSKLVKYKLELPLKFLYVLGRTNDVSSYLIKDHKNE